jgi:hypothetical protein
LSDQPELAASVPPLGHSSPTEEPDGEPLADADATRVDGIEVIECEVVRIASALQGRSTVAIPFTKQLWGRRQFLAHFEPEVDGLWVSATQGVIEPGAVEFPFVLFFAPEEKGKWETTLTVSFGDFEARVPIVASTVRGKRHHHK